MGLALAAEAARRGADVTLVTANVALPPSPGVGVVAVETAEQLRRATLERFPACDVLLMAAAVADYRPAQPQDHKISKEEHEALDVALVRTSDVLAEAASLRRPGQSLVGFAAEHGPEAAGRARGKLERKGLDAIVVNDIARGDIGFDAEDNEVTIVSSDGATHVPRASKAEVAAAVLDFVQELRARSGARR
jgi:phosphopantothenoylcysteine decarboxylase/phosphopantothenate--cysteine ligase